MKYGRPRRQDIEEAGGYVPTPELLAGQYLVDLLFRIGPGKKDGPLEPEDLVHWQALLGMTLQPWEAEALYRMSQGYLAEIHSAVKHDAPPPWKDAVLMWRWVQNWKAERRMDKLEETEDRKAKRKKGNAHGDRQ